MTGQELKKIRRQLGLTQTQLTAALCLSTRDKGRYIRRLENNHYPISDRLINTLKMYARGMKLNLK